MSEDVVVVLYLRVEDGSGVENSILILILIILSGEKTCKG